MPLQKIFAANLKEARIKHGWTQEDLAERAGLSPTAIQYYENNRRQPKGKTLEALAEALGVPEERLFQSAPLIPRPDNLSELEQIILRLREDMEQRVREDIYNQLLGTDSEYGKSILQACTVTDKRSQRIIQDCIEEIISNNEEKKSCNFIHSSA